MIVDKEEIWNRVYSSDNSFFGEEPSSFALFSFNYIKSNNNTKKILDLGAGHGRDSIFFALNGFEEVEAIDYSVVAVEILTKIAKEKKLPITSQVLDVKNKPLPYRDGYFDAVYSNMLLNMRFSLDELRFILSEIRRVLKPQGFNFFSVRNHHDKFYGKGQEIEKGIYDINGFQIRFFAETDIQSLASSEGFEILEIKEEFEEPVTLYLVTSKKR
jgi:SAM-dependent methyltransferase